MELKIQRKNPGSAFHVGQMSAPAIKLGDHFMLGKNPEDSSLSEFPNMLANQAASQKQFVLYW